MKTKILVLNKKTVAHLSAKDLTGVKGGTGATITCRTCDYCTIKSCIICTETLHPDYCGPHLP